MDLRPSIACLLTVRDGFVDHCSHEQRNHAWMTRVYVISREYWMKLGGARLLKFHEYPVMAAVGGSDDNGVSWSKPLDLLRDDQVTKMCSPMVRYSKLAFRMLVRQYGCDIAYTPMIIADSFVKSLMARDSEFTTCKADRPLIVQFAANNATDLSNASEIVAPYSDGIGLNCGCPQRWAISEGYGACLLQKPELIRDMIRQVKSRVPKEDFTASIKIRIHSDMRKTVSLCQQAEKAGVSWISVHGRTKEERGQPVNTDAIKLIKESVAIPIVANGDIKCLADVTEMVQKTGVNGVMAARGMLQNPAMFAGHEVTPLKCVKDWVDLSLSVGTPFQCFHHHLMYMLERVMSKPDRRLFNTMSSTSAALDYLEDNFGI